MAVAVTVIVPYRPDSGPRDASWRWLRAKWAEHHPGWQVVTGDPGPGEWCKARAVAAALPEAAGDVLVVADADVWCDDVAQAVDAVETGSSWAVPHRDVHRLTDQATAQVMAGEPFTVDLDHDQRPYPGHPGGGIVVLTRDLYDQVPLDARFVGWGQEDDSWGAALRVIAGRAWRGRAALWHLWHPPQARQNRTVGSDAGEALYLRYLAARRHPQLMADLIAEGMTACRPGSS